VTSYIPGAFPWAQESVPGLFLKQAALKMHHPPLFRKEKRKKSSGLNKQKTQSAYRLNLKQMVKLRRK